MNSYNNDYFKGRTSNYPKKFGGYEILNSFFSWKKRTGLINELLPKGSILDIGCAYGYMLKYLKEDYEKFGIDISEHAINECKKQKINAKFMVLDFEKEFNKIRKKEFDFITCFEVLEHLKKPKKELRKMHKLLKKEGYLFISIPVFKGCYLEKLWQKTDHDPTHIHLLKREDWNNMVKKAGFKIINNWASLYDELIWFKKRIERFNKFGNFYYILAKKD